MSCLRPFGVAKLVFRTCETSIIRANVGIRASTRCMDVTTHIFSTCFHVVYTCGEGRLPLCAISSMASLR